MGFHVGGDLLLVGQRAERGAIELRAAVASDQHMRDQAVAITLERSAQHLHLDRQALLGRGDVSDRSEPVDPGGSVGNGRGRCVRGAEQRLLAASGDGIAGEVVETGQCRQAGRDSGLLARFGRSGLPFRSIDAHGGCPCDHDG